MFNDIKIGDWTIRKISNHGHEPGYEAGYFVTILGTDRFFILREGKAATGNFKPSKRFVRAIYSAIERPEDMGRISAFLYNFKQWMRGF